MSKLLIVEESIIVCGIYKKLLEGSVFDFDIVQTYQEAKNLLAQYRYEFSVVSRKLPDANHGEVIALLNKHNVAPIVYANSIDEGFIESFESARIVEYILRHKFDNVKYVISRLHTLRSNKQCSVLLVHNSSMYKRYLKQNLLLHNFKVLMANSADEALEKLQTHKDICLMLVSNELYNPKGMEELNGIELVKQARQMKLPNLGIISLAEEINAYETSLFLNEGADDYLLADSSRDEFYVRIYQNLKR